MIATSPEKVPPEAARYINGRPLFLFPSSPYRINTRLPKDGRLLFVFQSQHPPTPQQFFWQLTLPGYVIVGLRSANPTYGCYGHLT